MKRIVVNPAQSIFKVSRPGFDAETTSPSNIAFDGYSGRYNGVYMSGVTTPADGWSFFNYVGAAYSLGNYGTTANATRVFKQINFAKTFATPPQLVYSLRRVGDRTAGAYPRFSQVTQFSGNNAYGGLGVWAHTTTTYLYLRMDYPQSNSIGAPTDWEVAWVVFQT